MSPRAMQIELERRIIIQNPERAVKDKVSSDTLFAFLNEALDKFVKTRYSGINYKREGFEQSQKRIDDLRTLVVNENNLQIIKKSNDMYEVCMPYDYMFLLGDRVGIQPIEDNECWEKDSDNQYVTHYSDTIEGTIETIDRIKENSLSEYRLRYNKAKPIRVVSGDHIILHTDGKYQVSEYSMQYLKTPTKLSPSADEYIDLPEHTHIEIVKLALQLFYAATNQNAYETQSNEIPMME